jgi:hypothetical protein
MTAIYALVNIAGLRKGQVSSGFENMSHMGTTKANSHSPS